ncbi:MAG: hypothetical protein IJD79_09710 [Clostridia bacterium]|nr:hypothetical protein [Clostridia bacterium]
MNLGNIMIFGDSYSTYEGHIPSGYAVYYSGHRENQPDVYDVNNTWWKRLIDSTDSTLIQNNSWSGSTIGYTGYNNSDCSHSSSFIYRFEKLLAEGFFDKNKIDTLFVFGGTNDSWSNAPLGEFRDEKIAESDLFSVLPAISHFAKRLSENLPDTRIIFIGNCDIKSEITDAIRCACEREGFVYVALAGVEKVNGHPTELGMAEICDQVLRGIEIK